MGGGGCFGSALLALKAASIASFSAASRAALSFSFNGAYSTDSFSDRDTGNDTLTANGSAGTDSFTDGS